MIVELGGSVVADYDHFLLFGCIIRCHRRRSFIIGGFEVMHPDQEARSNQLKKMLKKDKKTPKKTPPKPSKKK